MPPDAAAILQARALALARPAATGPAAETLELLEFRLGQDRYALETRHVSAVVPLGELTLVPCTPPFILGVVNVRGRITAVVDLQRFLELPPRGLTDLHHIVMIRRDHLELGLLADAIGGVGAYAPGSLQPPLPAGAGALPQYLMGVTADRLMVIDVDRLLAAAKLVVNEEVGNE
jgi:purine-binding chemotaxis protein CheW